ncbi:hypothetical protein SAMN04489859_101653 [Paracoccus alcaliphilus]|uniref:Uncharacterized protein n=1 Tax=Paracoccus alcaliphilus TaxID=34002 RepID=A0A1H8JC20_9RHOB|nr:hypothetical protein [Paracoccus alcaliphilus]SEN77678.1 hypothetical protein SAMN04489859_101653 [Paracoccus alcaliphilus]
MPPSIESHAHLCKQPRPASLVSKYPEVRHAAVQEAKPLKALEDEIAKFRKLLAGQMGDDRA